LGFVHWGGDKTWLAPQERWPDALPFLDLDSGAYTLDVERDDGGEVRVAMRSPVCRETGARIVRTIAVRAENDEFTVTHVLENVSANPITWGLWDVHQINGPGIAYVPRRASSPFRDGVKAYPAEGDSEGARPDVVPETWRVGWAAGAITAAAGVAAAGLAGAAAVVARGATFASEVTGFSAGRTTCAISGPPVTSAPVARTAAAPALSDRDAAPAPPAPAATSATRATVESPADAIRVWSRGSGVIAVTPPRNVVRAR